jgi:hypothetical protein
MSMMLPLCMVTCSWVFLLISRINYWLLNRPCPLIAACAAAFQGLLPVMGVAWVLLVQLAKLVVCAIHSFIDVTPVAEAHTSNAYPFQTPPTQQLQLQLLG